jgi:DNA-binding transcriptional MerR regulator
MCQKEKPKMNQFFSIRQVADRLGVAFYRVKYAHQAGHVQEPMRVGNTRFYAVDDIRRLEHYFPNKGGVSETRVPHE